MNMQLTANFDLDSLTASKLAYEKNINNEPDDDTIQALRFTAAGLERVRACLGFPILITSGYRCRTLNILVHGQVYSQHILGQAADFVCPQFGDARRVASHLSQYREMLGIDQLIFENTWVHVSFTLNPRYQALSLRDGSYLQGII